MTAHSPIIDRLCRLALGLALVLAAVGGVGSAPRAAEAGFNPAFVVSSDLDTNSADSVLTLREALGAANGTITGPFTPAEQNLLGGCTFDGFNNINPGTCGAGVVDTIEFSPTLGVAAVINLTAPLPFINDTVATRLRGLTNNAVPILFAAAMIPPQDGLVITSDNNIVNGITVVSSPRDGFLVTGDNNVLAFLSVRVSGRHGLYVDGGAGNGIHDSKIGVFGGGDVACGVGNGEHGVALDNGADNNVLFNNLIACNGLVGVDVRGAGTDSNIIGPNNAIGTNAAGATDLGNLIGVLIYLGAQYNQVVTNTIAYNSDLGVHITGSGGDTAYNSLRANSIRQHGGTGVLIDGGAHENSVGLLTSPTSGNVISDNGGNGIYISDSGTHGNSVCNNRIGTDPAGLTSAPNTLNGVMLTNGTYNNRIGEPVSDCNLISGNGLAGVRLDLGAHHNFVDGNDIGLDATGLGGIANDIGLVIAGGAYSNSVGTGEGNQIGGNGSGGIHISGSATASNTISYNEVGLSVFNGGNGITLDANTHDNRLLVNEVWNNLGTGIELSGGANNNTITRGGVQYNGLHGISLSGSGTVGNVISGTAILFNNLDGINERSDAGANWWSHLYAAGNGGLGIDKDAGPDGLNAPTGPFPVVTGAARAGHTLTISGTAVIPGGALFSTIELHRAAPDPSGYGEGSTYLGSALVSGGTWAIVDSTNTGRCYTAVQRDTYFLLSLFSSTSTEFGLSDFCFYELSAPVVLGGSP